MYKSNRSGAFLSISLNIMVRLNAAYQNRFENNPQICSIVKYIKQHNRNGDIVQFSYASYTHITALHFRLFAMFFTLRSFIGIDSNKQAKQMYDGKSTIVFLVPDSLTNINAMQFETQSNVEETKSKKRRKYRWTNLVLAHRIIYTTEISTVNVIRLTISEEGSCDFFRNCILCFGKMKILIN